MADYINSGPYAVGYTSFDPPTDTPQPTYIAEPPDGSVGPLAAADPTFGGIVSKMAYVLVGAGAPSAAASNGTLYINTSATTGDDILYGRIAGAWVALKGA